MNKFEKRPAKQPAVKANSFEQDVAGLRKHLGGCYAIIRRWEEAIAKRKPAA